jgi:hypothetical protein
MTTEPYATCDAQAMNEISKKTRRPPSHTDVDLRITLNWMFGR